MAAVGAPPSCFSHLVQLIAAAHKPHTLTPKPLIHHLHPPPTSTAGGVTFDAVLDTRRTGGEEEVLLAWMPTWMKASWVPDLANAHWRCTRPEHYMPAAAQQGGASGSGNSGSGNSGSGNSGSGNSGNGNASRRPQTARKTAHGADSNMDDEPPAKRGPGRPRKVPKLAAPKLAAPKPASSELMTPEMLYAKRGPGRPPKWLTEARRAAEAAAKPKPMVKPKPVVRPKRVVQPKPVVRPKRVVQPAKRKPKVVSLAALAATNTAEQVTPEVLFAKRGPGRPPKWLTEARRAAGAALVLAGLVA